MRFSKLSYKELSVMFKFLSFTEICYNMDKDYKKYFDINILKEYEGEVVPDILINCK